MPKITRLPDGTYETRISVIDPRTGKRHQPRVRARSKRELDKAIARERATILAGEYRPPDQTTLRELLETWLAAYKPRTESTWRQRADAVRKISQDKIADIRLSALETRDIQDYIDRLGAEYTAVSIHERVSPIRAALRRAHRVKTIPENPWNGVELPERVDRPETIWTPAQVRTFLNAAKDDHFYALFVLAASLGMRVGELIGLRWADIDFDDRSLTVSRSVTRNRDGTRSVGERPKSKSGKRRLLLPIQCVEALTAHKLETDKRRQSLGELWSDDDAVFDQGDGSFYTHTTLAWRRFRVISSRVDVPEIRLHDLRHSAATAMIRANVPIPTVSRILGHANPAITMRIYAHVLAAMEEEAVATIEGIIGDIEQPSVPKVGHHHDNIRVLPVQKRKTASDV